MPFVCNCDCLVCVRVCVCPCVSVCLALSLQELAGCTFQPVPPPLPERAPRHINESMTSTTALSKPVSASYKPWRLQALGAVPDDLPTVGHSPAPVVGRDAVFASADVSGAAEGHGVGEDSASTSGRDDGAVLAGASSGRRLKPDASVPVPRGFTKSIERLRSGLQARVEMQRAEERVAKGYVEPKVVPAAVCHLGSLGFHRLT